MKDPEEVVAIFKLYMWADPDLEAYRRILRGTHEIAERISGSIALKENTGEDGEAIEIERSVDEAAMKAWNEEPERLEA
jgi:hypothetical protein